MKKVVLIGLLVLTWIYGSGYWAFTDTNVNNLFDEWELASARGDAEAVCSALADDMTFSMEEHAPAETVNHEGGKNELCAHLRKLVPAVARAVTSTSLKRDDLTVKRSWLHPWSAEVSYTEYRTTVLVSGRSVKTISNDRIALVKSLKGVLVRQLESESRLDDGT